MIKQTESIDENVIPQVYYWICEWYNVNVQKVIQNFIHKKDQKAPMVFDNLITEKRDSSHSNRMVYSWSFTHYFIIKFQTKENLNNLHLIIIIMPALTVRNLEKMCTYWTKGHYSSFVIEIILPCYHTFRFTKDLI